MSNYLIRILILLPAIIVISISSSANAAILNVSPFGVLMGASQVFIEGNRYNVSFENGSCQGIFSGCDSPLDFAFRNQTDAIAGAQALMNQVFLDAPQGQYDSTPNITNGCHDPANCLVIVPFGFAGPSTVDAVVAFNSSIEAVDSAGSTVTSPTTYSTVFSAVFVYAKFERQILVPPKGLPSGALPALSPGIQAVPVPASLLTLGTMFACVVALRLRVTRSA